MNASNPSDEIRGRAAAIVARLEVIAHSTGDLDDGAVSAAVVLVEHEIAHITTAMRRLPKGGQP